jgi:hypothetical protein
MPTETIPAPSNEREPAAITPLDTDDVVLPTANTLMSGFVAAVEADITIELFDMPTETMPAPSNESEPAAFAPLDTDEVVLPTANNDSNGFVAAVEADTTKIPAAAPVVDIPTETIPAPDIDIALRV